MSRAQRTQLKWFGAEYVRGSNSLQDKTREKELEPYEEEVP